MSERQKKKVAQKEANRLKRRMIEKVLSNSKASNVAFNLNYLVDGWLELESDPGTFSLLIEDFGCFGAQVDEIYDLEQKFEGPVFGFIFLFKWLNNQSHNDRIRNQKSTSTITSSNNDNGKKQSSPEQGQWSFVQDETIISKMFFAKQMISNSCATHALISILLNCDYDKLNLGPTLTRLKEHTKIMDPENKGYAIGNLPELAKAHNSHASYSSLYNRNKPSNSTGLSYMISGNQRTSLQQQKKQEAYHFVSYIPINNKLYELDGLKDYPIDHGPIGPKEDWTEKFRSVIKQRLRANKAGDDSTIPNEIRYNLMAVVPDKRVSLKSELRKIKRHYRIVQDSIKRLTKRVSTPLSIDVDIPNPPYSPLSNGTLTASETGSASNSPVHQEENFSEDDDKFEKYFFIKFDQKADSSSTTEENLERAHKNCIIKEQPTTNFHPLDLTKDQVFTNEISLNNEEIETKDKDKPDKPAEINEEPILTAHTETMYGLSAKPPFEFNILDDMQHVHFGKSTLRDLRALSKRLMNEIEKFESQLKEEVDKRRKYKIDNSRRTHNYEPFIMTFLSMLARQGNLADLIEKDLGLITEVAETNTITTTSTPTIPTTATATALTPASRPGPKPAAAALASKAATNTTPTRPKYKYVSTGRPVGRPRKHPLPPPK